MAEEREGDGDFHLCCSSALVKALAFIKIQGVDGGCPCLARKHGMGKYSPPQAGLAVILVLKRPVHPSEGFPRVFPTPAKLQGASQALQRGPRWSKLKVGTNLAAGFESVTKSCPLFACRVRPLKLTICEVFGVLPSWVPVSHGTVRRRTG